MFTLLFFHVSFHRGYTPPPRALGPAPFVWPSTLQYQVNCGIHHTQCITKVYQQQTTTPNNLRGGCRNKRHRVGFDRPIRQLNRHCCCFLWRYALLLPVLCAGAKCQVRVFAWFLTRHFSTGDASSISAPHHQKGCCPPRAPVTWLCVPVTSNV